MNAIELFHADGKPCGIYHCEKCRVVHREKQLADECCLPRICDCGAECPQCYTVCDDCRRKKEREREAERFAKAEKVTEWNGAIYSDGRGWNEGFFANVEDLEDWLACEEEDDGSQPDRPEYVWTCDDKPFCQLEYDHIIENATQEAYEDWDAGNISGEKELKAAIEAFNEANKEHVSWEPNMKRALLLPPLSGRAAGDGVGSDAPTTEAKENARISDEPTRQETL
jgi:hypothetical protein